MPLWELSFAFTPSTLTPVLDCRKTPKPYPLTEPFLTVMTSKVVAWSVMAEPLPGHVPVMDG
jgi:hypothetical protein